MPTRKAEAEWQGNLAEGSGRLKLASGAFDGPYSFKSRFEEGQSATNPEELIGAAHAGCFTMALTAQLSRGRITPTRIHTDAKVKLEKVSEGFSITTIELETEANIPGIDDATFQKHALDAKLNFIPKDRYLKIAALPNTSGATAGRASLASSLAMKCTSRLLAKRPRWEQPKKARVGR
jgi:lipoyl-dependent peroxiredoxin